MSAVQMTAGIDYSGLQRAIPELVSFGRRTMREQCVTSMVQICRDAQELMPAVSISRIDAELDEVVTVGKSKTNTMTRGQAIILARMNPTSHYNQLTGGRWLMRRPTLNASDFRKAYGDGGMARSVLWGIIEDAEERQKAGRHSSTHFLQHGWTPSIKKLVQDPDCKLRGWSDQTRINPLNTMDQNELGTAKISPAGSDTVTVTAENDIGSQGSGNAVLDAKHKAALIQYGSQPAQAAVEREEAVMVAKIESYLERGFRSDFVNL